MGRQCDACQTREGTIHVTVRVEIYPPTGMRKIKVVQFWLCAECESANRQVLAKDADLARRLAKRLTTFPEYLSRWRDWRERGFLGRQSAKVVQAPLPPGADQVSRQ